MINFENQDSNRICIDQTIDDINFFLKNGLMPDDLSEQEIKFMDQWCGKDWRYKFDNEEKFKNIKLNNK